MNNKQQLNKNMTITESHWNSLGFFIHKKLQATLENANYSRRTGKPLL